MLTKEERAAIAARVASYDGGILTWNRLYECLLDAPITGDVSIEEDSKYVIDCLIDLCDTSNMLELPLDKDGEVIRVGDTVYIGDGIKYEVAGYMMRGNSTEVILAAGAEPVYTKEPANDITHKKPETIASLVGEIRRTLSQNTIMNKEATSKLWEIADQIEMLSDGND